MNRQFEINLPISILLWNIKDWNLRKTNTPIIRVQCGREGLQCSAFILMRLFHFWRFGMNSREKQVVQLFFRTELWGSLHKQTKCLGSLITIFLTGEGRSRWKYKLHTHVSHLRSTEPRGGKLSVVFFGLFEITFRCLQKCWRKKKKILLNWL